MNLGNMMQSILTVTRSGLAIFILSLLISCGGGSSSSPSPAVPCLNPGNFTGVYQNTFTTPDGYSHEFLAFAFLYQNQAYLIGGDLLTVTSTGQASGSEIFSGSFTSTAANQCLAQVIGNVESDIPASPLGVGGTSTFDASSNIQLFLAAPAQMNLNWLVPGGSSGGSLYRTSSATVSESAGGLIVAPTLLITPQSQTIRAGTRQQFSASIKLSDGTVKDVTAFSIWSSNDTAVATVANGGQATGILTGSAKITATFGSLSSNALLSVN